MATGSGSMLRFYIKNLSEHIMGKAPLGKLSCSVTSCLKASISLSVISVTFYDKLVVLEAFVLTLGVTVALTIYTLQSKRDFSSWGAG